VTPPEPPEPPHARFNFAALVGDVSCFFIGMAFLDSNTALPALINRLGGGEILLGVLLALKQAGYFLPQPISAHFLQGKTRFKPLLIQVALYGRLAYFVAAFFILFYGKTNPALALWAFAIAYTLSWFGDGAGGVPWTALVGKTIPAGRRGRLFATTQVVSGFSRLVVSGIVFALLFADKDTAATASVVGFPVNLALLVFGCATFLFISWLFLAIIREPEPTAEDLRRARATEYKTFVSYIATLPGKFRERPDLAKLAGVQILASAVSASAPFLIFGSAAAKSGGMPGLFLGVQTVGLLALAPVWGIITDRFGPRRALIGQLSVSLLLPAAALIGPVLIVPGNENLTSLLGLSALCVGYFFLGGVVDAWATVTNYILEALSDDEQTTFIGLMNAASAPSLLFPLGAGVLAATLGKPSVFIVAGILLAVGLYLALILPETRNRKTPTLDFSNDS
jgi:MFS family permease